MKKGCLIALLLIEIPLYAQSKINYVFGDFFFTDYKIESLKQRFVKDSTISIVFIYGFDCKKAIIVNIIDSNYYKKTHIENDNIIREETRKFENNNLFLNYIYSLKQDYHILVSQNLSTHSDGYRYHVYNGNNVIASFYSYYNINYYDFREEDKEKLTFMFELLKFLDI